MSRSGFRVLIVGNEDAVCSADGEMQGSIFSPAMDIYEDAKGVRIVIETPGMAPSDITVRCCNNTLVIRGLKRIVQTGSRVKYHLLERAYGYFEKVFELPEGVQKDKITARLVDGVFKIMIPYARP